jgi:oxepin-CoA hydrolase/3-oxo-5,6-dehydrosuberyl-CoA semialdehyde dehydrogenase
MLKALGLAIMARKEELYELSYETGATRNDGWIDIEGGAGTLFSSRRRAARAAQPAHSDRLADRSRCRKGGTFVGQHVWTVAAGRRRPDQRVQLPVWGMLESLGQPCWRASRDRQPARRPATLPKPRCGS